MAAKTTSSSKKPAKAPKTAVQEALEVTWVLKGHLKNAQIAYIRVGALLVQVRDKKLYEALKHPDIESYARERLQLGRASLYRYLQVCDWIGRFHKEWLGPKPQGFIPELTDVADLMWIEEELAKSDLEPKRKAALVELRAKAMSGRLTAGDMEAIRRQGRGEDGLKPFLSTLRSIRRRAARLVSMPPDAIVDLDAAIAAVNKVVVAQRSAR